MVAQTQYRLLSAAAPPDGVEVAYEPAEEPPLTRRTREPLGQYPYLRGLALDWLDRYDEAALDAADAFLTFHPDDVDAEPAGHDLAVYLCDWVVVHSATAQWFLDARPGICYVELPNGPLLDPYHHVVKCVADRQPIARRFVEQARSLGA
jgi:hypothetical protein